MSKQGPSPTHTPDYRLEDQIGFRLRKAHQRASEIFNDVMAEFDVTPTQFAVLARLREHGEATQNALGRMTAMDPATVFGVVSRLKRRGFIDQRTNPADGRAVLLRLSQDGERAAAAMCTVAGQVSERTLHTLSRHETDTLLALLDRIGR